ncbi:hypothetical protein KKG05_10495 [bacterium]|nr:hypothetical protein [bacterium]
MKTIHLIFLILLIAVLVSGCADPRTPPPVASEPTYTETVLLWDDIASGNTPQSATFTVERELVSARLTVAGYITPDDDILWIEAIKNDSIPEKVDIITGYLVELDGLGPDTLWSHEDSIIGLAYRDSLQWETDDTTAMGDRRDSLTLIVDNRFTLALWLDEPAADTTAKYPEAIYIDDAGTLSGQHFYISPTDSASGHKARSFQMLLRQWSAADLSNVGRPIEINWLRNLSVGNHTVRVKLTGVDSRIIGTIVLVYRESEI